MNKISAQGCSVVIRCYNEEKHIGRLLEGIEQQSLSPVEVIIVDSGSTDGTLSVASRYPVKILHVKPEEFSFGRSLNLGCAEASNDFIVIASAHVYPVYKDWLEHLINCFSDPQVALAYGKQKGAETTRYSEHRLFAKLFPETSMSPVNHPFCNNANAAVRRSLWEQLPYDETLTGLEDIDWAKRVIHHGYKTVYNADATVIHVHEETAERVYNRYRREAIALKRIFPEEQFNFWDLARLLSANIISDAYHAWHDRAFLANIMGIILFRLMQFWGTYQGFVQRGPVSSQLKQKFYYPNELARTTSLKAEDQERRVEYEERKVRLPH